MFHTSSLFLALAALSLTAGLSAQQYHLYDASLVPGQNLQSEQLPGGGFGRTGTACDDFNRADGTDMGPDWIEISGDNLITGNMGAGAGGFVVNDMTHASATCDYQDVTASVDFLPATGGPSVAYVVLIAGVGANNIYVKVQDNDADGQYDRCFFYHSGNGGGTWNATWFFDLATPVTSGTITLSFPDTDTAQLDVDGGAGVETFTVPGILSAALSLGTSVGLGTFGSAAFDNYDLNGGCGGFNLSITGGCPGGGPATVDITGATPNGNVAIAYSVGTGSFVIPSGFPCASTVTGLSGTGTTLFGTFTADGSGNISFGGTVPSNACGVIAVQAVDLTSCATSNTVSL